jgi:hypothetical protein
MLENRRLEILGTEIEYVRAVGKKRTRYQHEDERDL